MGTYPERALQSAARRILDMCREAPVAIDAETLDDRDVAAILITTRKLAMTVDYEPHDVAVYFRPNGRDTLAPLLRRMGFQIIDYRQLMREFA